MPSFLASVYEFVIFSQFSIIMIPLLDWGAVILCVLLYFNIKIEVHLIFSWIARFVLRKSTSP